jgi:hypothetical protein
MMGRLWVGHDVAKSDKRELGKWCKILQVEVSKKLSLRVFTYN